MIDKCGTLLDVLKTSPSMKTSSKICKEISNELWVIHSNVGSIVDNQSSNNKSFKAGNKSYLNQRLESAPTLPPNRILRYNTWYVYIQEGLCQKRAKYLHHGKISLY